MEELIRKEDVTDLYICGIATDVCVGILTNSLASNKLFTFRVDICPETCRHGPLNTSMSPAFTAFHSQEQGFRTILVEDASRGIQVQ